MPTLTATIRHAEIGRHHGDGRHPRRRCSSASRRHELQIPTVNGTANGTHVEMLVSDGDIPREVSGTGSAEWQRPVDNAAGLVDFLERHLVTNNPRGNAANAYSTVGCARRGAART